MFVQVAFLAWMSVSYNTAGQCSGNLTNQNLGFSFRLNNYSRTLVFDARLW